MSSTLKHYDEDNGLVETSLTADHGIYAKDVTFPEHRKMVEELNGKEGTGIPLDEQLLVQCRAYVRDVNGEEFDNLKTLDDLSKFGLRRIKGIVAACIEALQVKI